MKPVRLLLAASEAPTVGGSSTASYGLFRQMLRDGWDAHYLQLIHQDDAPYCQAVFGPEVGNPQGLPNVERCWLQGGWNDPHPELTERITALAPDVTIASGFLAAALLKVTAPERRVVYLTGTCRQAQDYVTSQRVRDAISLSRALASGLRPLIVNRAEQKAVERCDLVITKSQMTLEMMQGFFPWAAGRIYPNAISSVEWIVDGAAAWRHLARPFEQRDVDVLFVASDWGRPEKNYAMVKAISERLHDARVHVVGDVPHPLRSVTPHGFLASREAIFDLFGRSRSVVCPSLMDSAPGILFEGSTMGCNVVASKNCGNWELVPPELLAEPYGRDAFVACSRRAMRQKYNDGLEQFFERRSYRELMALLSALAQPFALEAVP